ncbi:MAG: serine/threonine protein kinase, partial [Holophagales bacterium]|nr:serine/threonine protein kinase [Holophagales bacterium]
KIDSFERIRLLALMVGGGALVAGVLLAFMLAVWAQRPMKLVADAASQGAAGHLDVPVPELRGDAGRVAEALRSIFGKLREKTALEFVVGRLSRLLPEASRGGGSSAKPVADQACLVGIDMRRYVDPKLGYDPEDCIGKLDRDLQRIGASSATQKGRVVGLFGHRVLLQFTGEYYTYRATCAAAEILLTLSERDSVFDEPNPPAVALAVGPAVSGAVNLGDKPASAVAGVTVQDLEALLREASPGFLYFTKDVYPQIAPLFQRAEVEAKGQHSRLGGDPLYYVDSDSAARATGAKALTDPSGEGRTFADLGPGLMLANRFELEAELGAGPMGIVYKARDRDLGDVVTLKMLRPEVVEDASMFERLKRGVARARSIRHPNILSVLDFGEAERMPYVEMEFVRAMTLEHMLSEAGQLPVLAGVRLARQIAWAVQAAHAQQLMHGGLKPSNLLVEGNGDLKVMDFGLGMPVRPGRPVQDPAFLAPEQLEAREADSRADFYGFGAVSYTLLTGKSPFPGTTLEEVQQRIATSEPDPPTALVAEVPPKLEQILLRCLKKNPEERYNTIDQLVAELDEVRC